MKFTTEHTDGTETCLLSTNFTDSTDLQRRRSVSVQSVSVQSVKSVDDYSVSVRSALSVVNQFDGIDLHLSAQQKRRRRSGPSPDGRRALRVYTVSVAFGEGATFGSDGSSALALGGAKASGGDWIASVRGSSMPRGALKPIIPGSGGPPARRVRPPSPGRRGTSRGLRFDQSRDAEIQNNAPENNPTTPSTISDQEAPRSMGRPPR